MLLWQIIIGKIDFKINGKANLHKMMDVYPLSPLKVSAIMDLFDTKKDLNTLSEYAFPFSMYHERWKDITAGDFKVSKEYEKGADSRLEVKMPKKMSDFDSIDIYQGQETDNMLYLRKMIEYCQSNDANILVVYIPYAADDDAIAKSKYYNKICDEYDINYINFLDNNIINNTTDFYDSGAHLNVSGARKVTDYIGKYIMENYDISNQKNNETYSFWYEDYNEYIDLKIRNLNNNAGNLNNFLMLLYNENDIRYEIKISSNLKIEKGSLLQELLENLNNNYEIDDKAFRDNKDKTIKITTYDNRDGHLIKTIWF